MHHVAWIGLGTPSMCGYRVDATLCSYLLTSSGHSLLLAQALLIITLPHNRSLYPHLALDSYCCPSSFLASFYRGSIWLGWRKKGMIFVGDSMNDMDSAEPWHGNAENVGTRPCVNACRALYRLTNQLRSGTTTKLVALLSVRNVVVCISRVMLVCMAVVSRTDVYNYSLYNYINQTRTQSCVCVGPRSHVQDKAKPRWRASGVARAHRTL